MTRPLDFAGCATTLPPGPALAAWDATQRAFLAHAASTPAHLAETLRLAPDFALGFAAKGLFSLLLGRAELVPTARDCLRAARQAAARAAPTDREAAHVAALDDWLGGRPSVAADRLDAMLERHPHDALAMKLVQAIAFVMGRPGLMRRSVEALLPLWSDHPGRGYLLGCHAFTLEESGDYAAAIRAGEAALALAPDDAWGLHAVAHVHDMRGSARTGLDWLKGREAAWARCNNFRFHVWWHIALMHLDLGEIDAALALYDAEIRAERTDDYRDIANAASLLVRLEIEGVDVGMRWQELADLAEKRTADACVTFADLHYVLALIGGGRTNALETLLARMTDRADRPESEMDHVTRHPGLPAAEGLAAFGEGRHARAFARLGAARAAMPRIGGSHAQRDVFERLTIEAGLRAGRLDAVRGLLDDRSARRGAEDGYSARRRALIDRVGKRRTDAA
jgi:tetratricopeptide (TPR) repeat protein